MTSRPPAISRRGLAWVAIFALLIDALLPSALAAAASRDDAGAIAALCLHAGSPLPEKPSPALPPHHCALCATAALGLLPGGAPLPTGPLVVAAAIPSFGLPAAIPVRRSDWSPAQPRAPPGAVG
ncbi:MAG TPA: DUF2946 family protein [Stellaceae bacterium]|nr:DUF2946 family protein [Stellaceae bacterium]